MLPHYLHIISSFSDAYELIHISKQFCSREQLSHCAHLWGRPEDPGRPYHLFCSVERVTGPLGLMCDCPHSLLQQESYSEQKAFGLRLPLWVIHSFTPSSFINTIFTILFFSFNWFSVHILLLCEWVIFSHGNKCKEKSPHACLFKTVFPLNPWTWLRSCRSTICIWWSCTRTKEIYHYISDSIMKS